MARTSGYKAKLLEEVKALSEQKIQVLADFAAYLREREEWEATAEILGSTEMTQQIKKSRSAWFDGKRREFVSLDEIKARLNVL